MSVGPFADRARDDAREKVRGATVYAADVRLRGLLHAMTIPAGIAKGRLTGLPTDAALRVPGVVRVLTPEDFPPPSAPPGDGPPPPPPALEWQIAYRGQPIALVVAETLETAVEAAGLIRPTYASEPFTATVDGPGADREPDDDTVAGTAVVALNRAATTITREYETPPQHHNVIELLSTTAIWSGGRLTVYEASQMTGAVKAAVAQALSLDPGVVDVKCPSVGGGFGQRGSVQRQTALIARAAMLTGRPVTFSMPRGQIFHVATFRPYSRHRVTLGADTDGRMIVASYDAEQQQSRTGRFRPNYHESVSRLYGIDNYLGTAANIRIDTQPPGYMRAPWDAATFAFESAVDELAYQLGRDPVAMRLANDTRTDPMNGKPLSSRFLNECLTQGAERFGWSRRDPAPASMTAPDGTQIGWGVACGADATSVTPAIATLRVGADGTTRFATSGHEMGQGMYTAISAVLLRELDIEPTKLEIVLGDTTAAPQHLTAGAWGTASSVPVAAKAARDMRAAMSELLGGRSIGGSLHAQLANVRRPFLSVAVSQRGPGQDSDAFARLRSGQNAPDGPDYPDFTTMSYIAHFVEVRVEPRLRRIRVPRVVSVADCGRVVSPRTAASQVRGGIVWGLGAALREETEVDPRYGGFLNNDLADYVVPVNADVGTIDVGFVNRPDPLVNTIGSKSLGVLTIEGVAPAIANAVYHATGTRLRKLPIRVEHLL